MYEGDEAELGPVPKHEILNIKCYAFSFPNLNNHVSR